MSAPAPRQFKINRTPFSRHYQVLNTSDDGGAPLYHADQSLFTKDKANLTLHQGRDATGPVVAVAHLPRLSFDCKIGLGDPTSAAAADTVVWEELTRESRDASAHQWSMALPSAGAADGHGGGGGGGDRRTFTWKRTHKVSADGVESSSLTMRDLKLVQAGTEEVVAVFTSSHGWSSCGVLQINADYGSDFDVMVTITMLALYEKARKRRARVAAGGAST